MQEKTVETVKTPNALAFKSAIAYAIYFFALLCILKAIGVDKNDKNSSDVATMIYSLATYAPFVFAILFVQISFKKMMGNTISFKAAFSAGFKVAAYAGLFIALVVVFYYKVLDTASFDKLIVSAKEAAAGDPVMLKNLEARLPYMVFFIGFTAAINYTLLGLITSLIGAAVIKKDAPASFG